MDKKGCIIFDTEEFLRLTTGLELAKCMQRGRDLSREPSDESLKQLEQLSVADARSCSCCGVQFSDLPSQRAHFKLDWHRFNLKRQLAGLSSVREEVFNSLADKDDMESISGSESESEDDEKLTSGVEENTFSNQTSVWHSKVFFTNGFGQLVSIYHCLLSSSKVTMADGPHLVKKALEIRDTDSWAIIMLGGGHFAAGIFRGIECLVHKTFHCYTVRAKQGGSQSSRDNRGGSHPKSAGASLRRYNEQSMIQHVQEIISSWENLLKCCTLIFHRAVGPNNRSVLFGGKTPPLNKNDSRLRRIPFSTRRATYSEVLRVHSLLAHIEVHGLQEDFQDEYPPLGPKNAVKRTENIPSKSVKEEEAVQESAFRRARSLAKPTHNRAKSRPSPERPEPVSKSITSSDTEVRSSQQSKSKGKSKTKNETMVPMSSKSISKPGKEKEQQIIALEAEKKFRNAQKKEKKRACAALRKQQEEENAAKDPLILFQRALSSALESGTLLDIQACLSEEFINNLPAALPGGLKETLNLPLSGGNTALHIASKSGLTDVIRELMLAGADPSVKNKKSQPPYVVATCKETKTFFTDFMLTHPDLYNYSESQIPVPLTEEQERERADKKAALIKAKRAREKERRKVYAEQKAESEERERFLALSDREKRALAAEKRILAAQKRGTVDEKPLILARCFTCAVDITGQIPFEYEQFRFCTFDCLKTHRMQLKNSIK